MDYTHLNFIISDRSDPILVYLKNFKFTASLGKIAIDACNATLQVYCDGIVSIIGGDGNFDFNDEHGDAP